MKALLLILILSLPLMAQTRQPDPNMICKVTTWGQKVAMRCNGKRYVLTHREYELFVGRLVRISGPSGADLEVAKKGDAGKSTHEREASRWSRQPANRGQ